MKIHYRIAKTQADIDYIIEACKKTGYCSFDFETSSEKYYDPFAYPLCISIAYNPICAWVIPLEHKDSKFKSEAKAILLRLGRELLENKKVVKIAQNIKFEHKWLLRYNINLKGICLDTMLGKYLLDEERPNDLKSLVDRFYPEYSGYEDEVRLLAKKFGWFGIPLDKLAKYNAFDSIAAFKLMVLFEPKLIKLGFYPLFRNLLMMLSKVLAESEFEGLLVDKEYLEKIISQTEERINQLADTLSNNKRLKKFERAINKSRVEALIEGIRKEISALKKQGKSDTDRVITSRRAKIQDLLAGIFKTKKDLKSIEKFNFNSPTQLIELLFTHKKGFRFKVIKYTTDKNKRETDRPSTDEETLLKLKKYDKSGFIDAMLEWREIQKLYSTYMLGIQEKLDKNNRVHTGFLIHGTVTGRLSSVSPNLQNIPRDTTSSLIKTMFIPPKGMLLLEVDYSQAELRIVAELADEPEMINWFNIGRNIHVAVACKSVGRPNDYDLVQGILKDPNHPENLYWEKMKKRAKTINFGILYEQGPNKLAETLNLGAKPGDKLVTKEEAAKFREEWLALFPNIKKWIDRQHKLAYKQGYVKNMFGRKRRLPNIYLKNVPGMYGKYLEAQRQSVNAPIQGSSSDFTLFSQVVIREEKQKLNLPANLQQAYTVHDSIGFYVSPNHIHDVVPKLIKICENPETMKYFGFEAKKVRMKVSPEVGINWGSLKDYNAWEDYTTWVK